MIALKNPKITSEYGITRTDGKMHKGLDIISTSGDKNVRAIRRGTVSFVGYDKNGFGNYVVILQEDNYKVLYCHLEKYSVKVGQVVDEGEIIGIEGKTGNSTGVHLHLEVRKSPYKSNNHINVAEYLGIKNKKGVVDFIDREDYRRIVQEKSGIDNNSLRYLEFYRHGNELIEKLGKAMI